MEIKFNEDFIIDCVSTYLGCCTKAVMSDMRFATIADARAISIYMCYKSLPLSSVKLGKVFNRSHSSILYQVQTVLNRRKVDKDYAKKLDMVYRHLIVQKYLDQANKNIESELVNVHGAGVIIKLV